MGRIALCRFPARCLRQGPRAKFQQCLPLGAATGKHQRGTAAHRRQRAKGAVSLSELCAECACILSRSVSDIAATLSLPEALLLIRQDNRRQMEQLRYHTQSRALANAAIWSKSALRALGRFEKSLIQTNRSNETEWGRGLSRVYAQAGIPVSPVTRSASKDATP